MGKTFHPTTSRSWKTEPYLESRTRHDHALETDQNAWICTTPKDFALDRFRQVRMGTCGSCVKCRLSQ